MDVILPNDPRHPYWFGFLTLDNIELVAEGLKRLLVGKRYTFVAMNELKSRDLEPEVRTSQALKDTGIADREPISVWYSEDRTYASISVRDSYGSWSMHTDVYDSADDNDWKVPYISFKSNQVSVFHRAPDGNKLCWVIATESASISAHSLI